MQLPKGSAGPPAPAQLPADVAGFVGRAEQLDVLTSRLDRVAGAADGSVVGGPVVITAIGGTAGVGKTALALRWAHRNRSRFPDGQLYVDLRGYDPDEPVPATDALAGFLRALGVSGPAIPPTVDERAAAYRTRLAGRRMLVVLDNASLEEQVRPLLPGTASCVTVITSRDALGGLVAREGAFRLPLDVLSVADSVALLRAMIGSRVDEDPAAAAALAGQCAQLPLALRVAAELAASRLGVPLANLVAELADEQRRLEILDAGDDDRTRVRVVFSWSYLSLPPDAARLFRLLGEHPGCDVTRYGAAALAGTSAEEAGRLLELLARAHLVQDVGSGRYDMHDLLRAYAGSVRAGEESEVDRRAALRRLFDHYLSATAEATETLHPGERHRRPVLAPATTPVPPLAATAEALAWLDAERASLTRVCAYTASHGWPEYAIGLSALLYRHFNVHGHAESLLVHAAARDAARHTGDRATEARSLVFLGIEYGRRSAIRDAEGLLLEGVGLARQAGDLVTEGMGLGALAIMCWHLGRYTDTLSLLRQGLAVHRRSGDAVGESSVLQNLGTLHFLQGRWSEAQEAWTGAMAAADRTGFRDAEVNVLCGLADVYTRQGYVDRAAECLDRAMGVAQSIGDRVGEAAVLRDVGQLRLRQGRYDEAIDPLQRAIAVFMPLGIHDGEGQARSRLGEVRRWQGHLDESADLLEQALALHRKMGDVADQCATLNRLGATRHAMGRLDEAQALLRESIILAERAGLRYDEANARAELARVHSTRCEAVPAGDQARRAQALYAELGVPDGSNPLKAPRPSP